VLYLVCVVDCLTYYIFCRVNNQSLARGMKQFLEIVTIGIAVRQVEITSKAIWMKKSRA
jgi:hypothetical protein